MTSFGNCQVCGKELESVFQTYCSNACGARDLPPNPVGPYWVFAKTRKGEYPEPHPKNSGKWVVWVCAAEASQAWGKIKTALEEGRLGDRAKVSAGALNTPTPDTTDRVPIIVYTYDWTDEVDVKRIREELRALGITWKIPYKTDEDTRKGIYKSAGHRGFSKYYE